MAERRNQSIGTAARNKERSTSVGVMASPAATNGVAKGTGRRASSETPFSHGYRSGYKSALSGANSRDSQQHRQAHLSSTLTRKTQYFPGNFVAAGSFTVLAQGLPAHDTTPHNHAVTFMTTHAQSLKLVMDIIEKHLQDVDHDPVTGPQLRERVLVQSSASAITTITLIVQGFLPAPDGVSQSRDQVMASRLADMILEIYKGKMAANAHEDWKGVVLYSSRAANAVKGGAVIRCRFSDLVPPSATSATLGASLILPGNQDGMFTPAPAGITSMWVLSLYRDPAQKQMIEAMVYMVADIIPTGQEMAQIMGFQYGQTQYEAKAAQKCMYGIVKQPERLFLPVSEAAKAPMLMSNEEPFTPQRPTIAARATILQHKPTPASPLKHARIRAWAKGVPANPTVPSPTSLRAMQLQASFSDDSPELITKLCEALAVTPRTRSGGRSIFRSIATAELSRNVDAVAEMARLRLEQRAAKSAVARGLFTPAHASGADDDDNSSVSSIVTVIKGHRAPVESADAPAVAVSVATQDVDAAPHSTDVVDGNDAATAAVALEVVGMHEADVEDGIAAAAAAIAVAIVGRQVASAIKSATAIVVETAEAAAAIVAESAVPTDVVPAPAPAEQPVIVVGSANAYAEAAATGHLVHWEELTKKGQKYMISELRSGLSNGQTDTPADAYDAAGFVNILTSRCASDYWECPVASYHVLATGWNRVADTQFPDREKPTTMKQCRLLLPDDITFALACARLNSNVQFQVVLMRQSLPDVNEANQDHE